MQQGINALQTISNNDLQRLAGASSYQKGQRDYIQGRADVERLDPDHATVKVRSDDGDEHDYRVDVDITPKGQLSFACDCFDFDGKGPCEHVVAAVLALKTQMSAQLRPTPQWETTISQALQTAATAARKAGVSASRPSVLAFSLQKRSSYWSIHLYSLAASRFPNVTLDDASAVAGMISHC